MKGKYEREFSQLRANGCGGYSTVFESISINDGKSYAIKKIPIKSEEKATAIKEIKILRSLNCDHVVSCFDSWIEENYYIGSFDADSKQQFISSGNLLYSQYKPFILHIQMELCSLTLDQFIKQMNKSVLNSVTKREYTRICDLFVQLIECVHYLHQQSPPIIHRDLKPENILLISRTSGYKVKLSDFGLSTYHSHVDQSHTKNIGTTFFRAPEVKSNRYDTKADIYSLGKIMENLFNFDLSSDSNESDLEIQSKYEKAKQICFQCVSYIPKQRPDCKQILNNIYLWDYNEHNSNNWVSSLSKAKSNLVLYNNLKHRWHTFDIFNSQYRNWRRIAIIQEIEEKAIFVTKDGNVYAIRISDHNEWSIFKNLTHQFMSNIFSLSIVKTVESKAIFLTKEDIAYTVRINESIDNSSKKAVIINELSNIRVKNIICGMDHVFCLTDNNNVYSFGDNQCGQLGNDSRISNYMPTLVNKLNNNETRELSCGAYQCLALTKSGKLFAWGYGYYGQTALGDNRDHLTPTEIISHASKNIISISCGAHHCLALSSNGELYGWGDNRCGQLGIGNYNNHNKPVLIENRSERVIIKITCGLFHSLCLTNDYSIYSFGCNTCGQLGVGDTIDRKLMAKVEFNIKFVDISCNWNAHISAGLSITGHYYVWGYCGERVITTPILSVFTSFFEIYTKFTVLNFLTKDVKLVNN